MKTLTTLLTLSALTLATTPAFAMPPGCKRAMNAIGLWSVEVGKAMQQKEMTSPRSKHYDPDGMQRKIDSLEEKVASAEQDAAEKCK